MVKVIHFPCVGDSFALCKMRNSCLFQPTASAVPNIGSMVTRGINPNMIFILLLRRLVPTTKNWCDVIWRQLYTDWEKNVLKVSNPFNNNMLLYYTIPLLLIKGFWNQCIIACKRYHTPFHLTKKDLPGTTCMFFLETAVNKYACRVLI